MEPQLDEIKNLLQQILAELRGLKIAPPQTVPELQATDSPPPNSPNAQERFAADGFGPIDQFKAQIQESKTLDDLAAIAFWLHDSAEGQSIREVPASYGWVLDQLKEKAVAASCDMSNVLAGTDVEMRRLGWDARDGRNHLAAAYGKRSRQELHEGQLLDFLAYLKTQPRSLLSGAHP